MNKQEKLNEMFEKVRSTGAVHTQGDFAECIGYSRSNVSRALNGDEKYLTANLFTAVENAFPDIFRPSDTAKDSMSEYGNAVPVCREYPSADSFGKSDKERISALIGKSIERAEEFYKLKDEIYELKNQILDWRSKYLKLETDYQLLIRQNAEYDNEIKKLRDELCALTPDDAMNAATERKGA